MNAKDQWPDGPVWTQLTTPTLIQLRGADRQTLVHNLCTADAKRLKPGQGCEAFFTDVRGKILAHVELSCTDDALWIRCAPRQAELLLPHLDKYIIREDVQVEDMTEQLGVIWLGGPHAESFLGQHDIALPTETLAHATVELGGSTAILTRTLHAKPTCFLIQAAAADVDAMGQWLSAQGCSAVEESYAENARIAAAYPRSGRDVTNDNLPQEVNRDAQAISFTKGCYLGQETVARIDALGHVNQYLVQLQFPQTAPAAGAALTQDGKQVGHVTSSGVSPEDGSIVALGYVRRDALQKAKVVQSTFGEARVLSDVPV